MRTILVAGLLLCVALAIPTHASAACSPTLDFAQVCVTAGTSPHPYACETVHFGGETTGKCTPLLP